MNNTFYHVAQRPLRIGTALTVGVYGERIRQEDFVARHYAPYIKEEIFEEVRRLHYPDAPSRLNCVFLYPDLNIAREYYANTCGYKNYVYAVEIEEGQPFVVEMDLLRCDGMPFSVLVANAHKYWQQVSHPNSGTLEAILSGRVIVKELVLEPSKIW